MSISYNRCFLFTQSPEKKTEDVSLNSNKNGTPTEVELLQQVTAELKAELNTLKEQLEREKKNSTEVKSLKTQQVCTLTFKLANAVRQRERAEEELAKIQKEMEELKEVIKSQEEKLAGKNLGEDTEYEKTDKSAESGFLDSEETGDIGKSKGSEMKGLENVLEIQENDAKLIESKEPEENRSESFHSKATTEEKEVESDLLSDLEVSGNDGMCLEPIRNKEEKLSIENSSPENLSLGEAPDGEDWQSDVSPVSSLALSGFESWKEKPSLLEKSEESEDFQTNTSSEVCFSSHANSSFETCDEFVEAKDSIVTELTIPSNHISLSESSSFQANVENNFTRSLVKPDGERDKISESGHPRLARKNRRKHSQNSEDQESSPPTSPGDESVGYLSERVNSPGHYGMAEDHTVAVHPGNYQQAHEVNLLRLASKLQMDDVTTGVVKETDEGTLEGFYSQQQTMPRGNIHPVNKDVDSSHKGLWNPNSSASQNVCEDMKELKEELKSALKEIEELRQENKEMKKEIRKLSTSAEENEFFVKTTQFTERLLREMREREAKVHAQRAHLTCETYRLDGDLSYSRNPEVSSMRWLSSAQRRSDECLDRLTQSKSSLSSLKVLGAKLKEITRSFENMAMDPELQRETLRQPSRAPDLSYYSPSSPYSIPLNDHLIITEQSITPARSSEVDKEISRENSTTARTALEKLGEEGNLVPSNTPLTEKDSVRRDKKFQITDHAPELLKSSGGSGTCDWHHDTKDNIQRYIVRSSDYIAKLRDLKPEEMTSDSKLP